MITIKFSRVLLAVAVLWTCFCWASPAALALNKDLLSALPGSEQWQPYLNQSPVDFQTVARDPLSVIKSLLSGSLWETLRGTIQSSADALLFLLLAALLSFFAGDVTDSALLDIATAGGCGVLLWGKLLNLAEQLCTQMDEWKSFLMGFLPVYAGVLTMGGETAAGGAASGSLLTILCFLAQCLTMFLRPLLQCYLAMSMACCISRDNGLTAACKGMGTLLHRGLGWIGKFLAFLLGLQRVTSLQLDRMALRTGKFLTSSIPVVGQSLSDASEAIFTGLQMLKSGLGLAAIAYLVVEFLPLYLGILVQLAILLGCSLFCNMAGVLRCQALLDCFSEAVRFMAASVALFFGLFAMGTAILFVVGGG